MSSSLEDLLKEAFKLRLYEAKVYHTLIKGTMNAKEVSQSSGVPLPRVYDTLRSLEEKGFAEEAGERFQALPPREALAGRLSQFEEAFRREQEERNRAKARLLGVLEPLYRQSEAQEQEIHLLRGIHAIANRFAALFSDSKDILLSVRKAATAKELFKPYLKHGTGKRIRILLSKDVEVSRKDINIVASAGVEMKKCGVLLFDVMVSNGRDVVIGVPDPLSEEVYHSIAIWVRNPSFAKSVSETLEELWTSGERVTPQIETQGKKGLSHQAYRLKDHNQTDTAHATRVESNRGSRQRKAPS